MSGWIPRWLGLRAERQEPEAHAAAHGATLLEIADVVRKSARAQARLTAKLDDLDGKLQGGFAELRASARAASAAPRPVDAPARWADVLDALDTLEHVASTLDASAHAPLVQGLRAVGAKLERALAQDAIERVGAPGSPVDARLLRVVGTDDRADLPDGVVTRVVRAAVVARGSVVREGEVFVNRRSGA